jgi:hypothetical protein
MSILIGIKSTHASGTFHGVDGIEGISMDGTKFDVILEDTHNELVHYVEKIRDEARIAKDMLQVLENKAEGSDMTNKQFAAYQDECNILLKIIQKARYDKFLILEGRTL